MIYELAVQFLDLHVSRAYFRAFSMRFEGMGIGALRDGEGSVIVPAYTLKQWTGDVRIALVFTLIAVRINTKAAMGVFQMMRQHGNLFREEGPKKQIERLRDLMNDKIAHFSESEKSEYFREMHHCLVSFMSILNCIKLMQEEGRLDAEWYIHPKVAQRGFSRVDLVLEATKPAESLATESPKS